MYKLDLYYKQGAHYTCNTEQLLTQLEIAQDRWNMQYSVVEDSALTEAARAKIVNDLRLTSPQARGRIVTSGGRALPLSGSKKLNLQNTPILVMSNADNVLNVYPHMLGTAYFDIESSLQRIIDVGPREHMAARGLLEEPLLKILSDHPTALEDGMSFVDAMTKVPAGEIDLLLRDKQGTVVVVEIETHATDFSVGQVSRLAHSFAQTCSDGKQPRRAIVCIDSEMYTSSACAAAGVELFQLYFRKSLSASFSPATA